MGTNKLEQFSWFYGLDPLRQDVIAEIGIDRLNQPMLLALKYGNWIAAAFELWNSCTLRRELGDEHCKDLAYLLEYGHTPLQ